MLIVDVHDRVDDRAWDARVVASGDGTIFQTSSWGTYSAAYLGDTCHYLVVRDGDRVVGQLLVLETLRGQESALSGRRRPLRRLITPLLKTMQWRQGPVVVRPDDRADVLGACLEAIDALAGEQGVTGMEEVSAPAGYEPPLLSSFAEHGYRCEARATIVVDVSRSIEQLWDGIKSEARTRVRKGQKGGVTVRQLRRSELPLFHKLVSDWRHSAGFPQYTAARYDEMMRHLGPQCAVFLAEHGGVAAAGAGIWHVGGWGHVFTPVHSPAARDTGAGDVMQWEMLRWSHEHGLRTLDLAGVAPEPRSDKERGIRRFKEKWGGIVAEYPVFTRVLKPGRWRLADSMRKARRALRSVRHGQ